MLRLVVVIGCVLWGGGCDFLRGYAAGTSAPFARWRAQAGAASDVEQGAARLVFDDFRSLDTDTLQTNALPWRLAAAAVAAQHPEWFAGRFDEEGWHAVLERRWGFARPARVLNWPGATPPVFAHNLGIVDGDVARDVPRLRFAANNHGCATCHAGTLWDAAGHPTRDVWLGLGSTSIDLARYSSDVYRALQQASRDPAATLAMLDRMFPALDALERSTLVELVLPTIRQHIGGDDAPAEPVPFDNGGVGLTNSVGHVKSHFKLLDPRAAGDERAFTQIPDLFSMPYRTSVLCDGVYVPRGDEPFAPRRGDAADRVAHTTHLADVATLFTVGTLGVPPARAHENLPAVQEAMRFTATLDGPPFPGVVDDDKARRGLAVWATSCASCHGERSLSGARSTLVSFPNRLVPHAALGTDNVRADAAQADLLAEVARTPVGQRLQAAPRGGYVAPTLIGVWATAPYLHNGSVPSLWHLLHPAQRPARFEQGGHSLDYALVGIAGALDEQGTWRLRRDVAPWMEPDVFDATTPGRTNVGHDEPFVTMSDDDKDAVLELMKTF